MIETIITTHKANPMVDPVMRIWGWPVALYLFLGGLTAGLMVLAGWLVLKERGRERFAAVIRLFPLAPVFISLGMLLLFLDLDYKLHVWRFYTAFRPSSPMSWGAWILLLVYPASILFILASLRGTFPAVIAWLQKTRPGRRAWALLQPLASACEKWLRPLAWSVAGTGILLGAYTGLLLGSLAARPFWNSPILPPLFLVSGMSAALALAALVAARGEESRFYLRLDAALVGGELALLLVFVIGLVSGSQAQVQAAALILGGAFSASFWVLVVGLGLGLPLLLELLELRGLEVPAAVSAALVIGGGIALRFVLLAAGQASTWPGRY
jgi:formate-dependent nitrite reductase membrane component NrfD